MRLFISYSRSDAEFVGRLVRSLEADGHDVWVDTEDIRGSEQWRASIVDGVRRADAVLLVVSPRSMVSENVAREITLAAEESRRIVPLVLEKAEMTGNIRFELAGVQQLSFTDRPFDAAMAELRAELRALSGQAPTTGRSPTDPDGVGSRRSGWSSRRFVLIGVILVAVAGGLIVATRGGGDGDRESSQTSTKAVAATDATSPPRATTHNVSLDAHVWFSGFAIAVDRGSYDPTRHELSLQTSFTNDQFGAADPVAMLVDGISALEWSGGRAAPFCGCSSQLPPGTTIRTTLTFDVGDGFSLEDAVLVFGGPGQHQAKIPLDGTPAESARPLPYDVTGVIKDGAGTTFTVKDVEVVPAACSGLADRLTFAPGDKHEVSVVVRGSAVLTANVNGGVNFGDAYLALPNGTRINSSSLSGPIYALYQNQPVHNVGVCFIVPAPASGNYRLVVTAVNVDPDPRGLVFAL